MRNRKPVVLGLGILLALALAITGCTTDSLATLLGGGGGGFVPTLHAPAVVVATNFNNGTVASFTVNASTGALTEAPTSPQAAFGCAWAVTATPDGKWVYVGDQCNGQVQVYGVNSSTGDLTAGAVTPLANSGDVPWIQSIGITPDGKYLYVADDVQLNGFSINDATGALTALPGFPITTGGEAFSVAVSPDGKYVYVSDDTSVQIFGYAINATTGALTPVPGSPFSCVMTSCEGVAVDGAAKFVYAVARGDQKIQGWKIGSGGTLTSVGAAVTADAKPFQGFSDPLGKYFFTMNDTNGKWNGYTINSSTGVLTAIASDNPFSPTGLPQGGQVDPSGKYVYATDCTNDAITGAAIGTGGALTTLASMPQAVNGGTMCGGLAVTHN